MGDNLGACLLKGEKFVHYEIRIEWNTKEFTNYELNEITKGFYEIRIERNTKISGIAQYR